MKPTDPTPRKPSSGAPRHDAHAFDAHHAQHGHSDHDGMYNEDVAHEYSDVDVRSLLMFSIGLVVIVAIAALAMWGMFRVMENQAAANDPVPSPLAMPSGQLPPEPRLLENEPKNLQLVRTEERRVLEGYSWVDQPSGVARIPIDEAKKRLLHQGLPVRPGPPLDATVGTNAAAHGEASGGRTLLVRPGANEPKPAAAPAPTPPAAPHKSGGH